MSIIPWEKDGFCILQSLFQNVFFTVGMKIQHRNTVLCSQFQTHICKFLQQIQIRLIPQSPGISCNGCHQYRIDPLCLIFFDIALQIRPVSALCLQPRKLLIIMPELEKHIISRLAVLRDHRIMPFLAEAIGSQSGVGMIRHCHTCVKICRKHLSPATVTGAWIIGIISGLICHCGISRQINRRTVHLFYRKSTDPWSGRQYCNIHSLIRKNPGITHRYNIADICNHCISELSGSHCAMKSQPSSSGEDQYLSHFLF